MMQFDDLNSQMPFDTSANEPDLPEETGTKTATKAEANRGDKYRLRAQAQLRQKEGINAGPIKGQRQIPNDSAQIKKRNWLVKWVDKTPFTVLELTLILVSLVFFVALIILALQNNSVLSHVQSALVALVPLIAVTIILGWIDRIAPLGWKYKVLAIFWGAGIGAGVAVVINSSLYKDILLSSGDLRQAELWASVLVAPLSEEFCKGMGVVIILVLARNSLSSNLSGMALGGLVGAGFAYVENIQYFLEAMQQGSTVFGFTLFARGVLSPFVHPMATSLTGWAVASAILSRKGTGGWSWRIIVGFAAAAVVHALWNGLASLGIGWIFWYLLIEVPLFVAWIVGLIVASSRQKKRVWLGLGAYVQTGWISVSEVAMVCDPSARKYAKQWGKRIGKPAPKLVRRFMHDLGRLGLDQFLMAKYGYQQLRAKQNRLALQDIQMIRVEFDEMDSLRREMVRNAMTGRGSRL